MDNPRQKNYKDHKYSIEAIVAKDTEDAEYSVGPKYSRKLKTEKNQKRSIKIALGDHNAGSVSRMNRAVQRFSSDTNEPSYLDTRHLSLSDARLRRQVGKYPKACIQSQ